MSNTDEQMQIQASRVPGSICNQQFHVLAAVRKQEVCEQKMEDDKQERDDAERRLSRKSHKMTPQTELHVTKYGAIKICSSRKCALPGYLPYSSHNSSCINTEFAYYRVSESTECIAIQISQHTFSNILKQTSTVILTDKNSYFIANV